jgi:formylglycine-generating enzyme
MRKFKQVIYCQATMIIVVLSVVIGQAAADVFNMPNGQTSLSFVSVGDACNVADSATGYGSVAYNYQMGKYDVTFGQYCQFLNAVAKTDTYGLYNSWMASYLPTIGITQSGSSGNYSYSVTGSYSAGVNCPMLCANWGNAARFCNWLQNGQPTGDQGPGTTETGAYTLNGDIDNLLTETRNLGATYFIPSEDEWYKAAYYKGGGASAGYWLYPTKSDSVPSNALSETGTNNANFYVKSGGDIVYTDPVNYLTPVGMFAASPGPYGAYDMGGNVMQWNETIALDQPASRILRGGGSFGPASSLASSCRSMMYPQFYFAGFRVASVPEPGSAVMLLAAAFGTFAYALARTMRDRG